MTIKETKVAFGVAKWNSFFKAPPNAKGRIHLARNYTGHTEVMNSIWSLSDECGNNWWKITLRNIIGKGLVFLIMVWIIISLITSEIHSLSVSGLPLHIFTLNLSLWSRYDHITNYRYIGRSEVEELLQSTTQIKRSNPPGEKLHWTHWSGEFNLVFLWLMSEHLTNDNP